MAPSPEQVVAAAAEAGLTIACAESLTGGAVCAALVSVPGASAILRGGVVAYATDVKEDVLGVDPAIIERYGVVSIEVATAMAEGVRILLGADVGLATTGAAGPEPHGGKAAGTVAVASVGPSGTVARERRYEGDREAVRALAVADALEAGLHALGETPPQGISGREHP
jgi:nicotinamide-nucleotide amidase